MARHFMALALHGTGIALHVIAWHWHGMTLIERRRIGGAVAGVRRLQCLSTDRGERRVRRRRAGLPDLGRLVKLVNLVKLVKAARPSQPSQTAWLAAAPCPPTRAIQAGQTSQNSQTSQTSQTRQTRQTSQRLPTTVADGGYDNDEQVCVTGVDLSN